MIGTVSDREHRKPIADVAIDARATDTARVVFIHSFHAAVRVGSSAAGRSFFSDETRLLLYALDRQATYGERSTCSRDVLDADARLAESDAQVRAMRETWENLGSMPSAEAMRLYVKVLDEEKPQWHDANASGDAKRTNRGMHAKTGERTLPLAFRECREGVWMFCEYEGNRPTARFQHAACTLRDKMYVVGGTNRGRFMRDTHELDLDCDGRVVWRTLKTKPGTTPLPACAGHRAVAANGSVYIVGGRFKREDVDSTLDSTRMSVYKMVKAHEDVDEVTWEKVTTHGEDAPCSRRGASVTMVGEHKCIVFGGEDHDRRFLNDAWILDMTSFVWREVKAPGGHPPEPRAEHSAAMWGPDTLLVFGGTGKSTKCFDSLHALDLVHQRWMDVKPQGVAPPPRAGHAGILVKDGRYWCAVGGGNNERGLSECTVLDLEEMKWVSRADALVAPPVVGEGMTLCVLSTRDGSEDVVIAFGGYNGHTQNETQILRIPSDFPEHDVPSSASEPNDRGVLKSHHAQDNARRDDNATDAALEYADASASERSNASSFETALSDVTLGVAAADISTSSTRTDAQLRKENAELRRALHRLRADAKIIADAHEKLRVRCSTLEQVAREDAKIIQDERDARDRLRAELERLRQHRADDDPDAKPRAPAATSWF